MKKGPVHGCREVSLKKIWFLGLRAYSEWRRYFFKLSPEAVVDWIVKSIFLVKEILTIQFTAKVMYLFTFEN